MRNSSNIIHVPETRSSHWGRGSTVYLLPADIISNGAALFPPVFPEAGVTQSEGRGEFSELEIPRVNSLPWLSDNKITHNFIAEFVVFPVVRVAGAFLCWPGGVEDQQRS